MPAGLSLDLDPLLALYAYNYRDNFVSNQTLLNEIISFNPVSEKLVKGKLLDSYLREKH